jgi:hypothetical protein
MKKLINHIYNGCVVGIFLILSTTASAQVLRTPANYIPDDEISTSPIENTLWVDQVFVNDDANVLENTARDLKRWEEEEEFERNWGVKRVAGHGTPSAEQKKAYVSRQMLRYMDKRLTGSVKKAEKGSTLHKVGTVQKALKPQSTVQFSKQFKLRFKARVLQRSASLYLVNPYFNNSLDINRRGQAFLRMSKRIKPLKLDTAMRVDFSNDTYASSLSRPITKKVRAVLSTSQTLKDAPFESTGDNRLELRYFSAF